MVCTGFARSLKHGKTRAIHWLQHCVRRRCVMKRLTTLSKARKKTGKNKTPYDSRQMRLPVLTEHERKLAARAQAAERVAEFVDEDADDAGEDAPMYRPWRHRIYNAVVGLCFVPFAWVLTVALWKTFGTVRYKGILPFYKTHEFVSLLGGCVVWMVLFFTGILLRGTPLLLRLYVIGHEFMHAWLAGFFFKGNIKEFKTGSEGGYIVTDKYNFIIALAPYLWPIYCIPVLAVWGVAGWFPWGLEYAGSFFAALGFTWMYHLSFTGWMLTRGQSDLLGPGRIFSLVLIYTTNVALLAAFVITMAAEFSWVGFGGELWKAARAFYLTLARFIAG